MPPAPLSTAAAPRAGRLQRLARHLAAQVHSLDLSGLRHLVGYGIACSALVVIVAGLIDPSAA